MARLTVLSILVLLLAGCSDAPRPPRRSYALGGHEPGLALAKDWIRAALTRQKGPLDHFYFYRKAPLTERLGLLAVMRGRAAMLEPPIGR